MILLVPDELIVALEHQLTLFARVIDGARLFLFGLVQCIVRLILVDFALLLARILPFTRKRQTNWFFFLDEERHTHTHTHTLR